MSPLQGLMICPIYPRVPLRSTLGFAAARFQRLKIKLLSLMLTPWRVQQDVLLIRVLGQSQRLAPTTSMLGNTQAGLHIYAHR